MQYLIKSTMHLRHLQGHCWCSLRQDNVNRHMIFKVYYRNNFDFQKINLKYSRGMNKKNHVTAITNVHGIFKAESPATR